MRKPAKRSRSIQRRLKQAYDSVEVNKQNHLVPEQEASTDQVAINWVSDDLLTLLLKDLDTGFSQIVEEYRPLLYNIALSILNNSHSAEDAVQEALMSAYEAMKKYPETRLRTLHVRAWLCKIALNAAKNYNNKERKELHADLEILLEEEDKKYERPEASVICNEDLFELYQLVWKLPPYYRAVVVLRYVFDFSYQEIADMLNYPLGTVGTYIARGIENLQTIVVVEEIDIRSTQHWLASGQDHKYSTSLTPVKRGGVIRLLREPRRPI